MREKQWISLVLITAFMLSGCASIVSKSDYPVNINSYPDEAKIVIKDENDKVVYKGETPTTVTLKAGDGYFHGKSYTIEFSKAGYSGRTAIVSKKIDGWYYGNIIFGGLVGILIVDPLTGAMWKLPRDITVALPENFALNNETKTLRVVAVDQVPDDLKQQMECIN